LAIWSGVTPNAASCSTARTRSLWDRPCRRSFSSRLPDDALNVVVLVAGHDDGHGGAVGQGGGEGAALPVADPVLTGGGADHGDRLEHADVPDGLDQGGIDTYVGADVQVQQKLEAGRRADQPRGLLR